MFSARNAFMAGAAKLVDLLWNSVTLSLKDIGINGATNSSFRDDGPYNFLPTRNGDVTQGTFSPFGALTGTADASAVGGSVWFDGTAGTALSISGYPAIGTSDFTIEFWINFSAVSNGSTQPTPFDLRASDGSGNAPALLLNTSSILYYYTPVGGTSITGTTVIKTNQWYHVAVTRSGTATKLFVNGVQEGSTYTDTSPNFNRTDGLIGSIFGNASASYAVNGYISNFRMVKGTALYTSAFAPSTAPLTAITNTSLLTCQSAASVTDASSNNTTVAKTGKATTMAVTPFGQGSAYFDGTGDYLTLPANAAFQFGTGDFTIECFVFISGTATDDQAIWECRASGATSGGFVLNLRTTLASLTNSFKLNFYTDGGPNVAATALPFNTWHHIAVTRSGSTVRLFVNGSVDATITKSNNFSDNPGVAIGQSSLYTGSGVNGFVSNIRAVKGTALYTAAFTPPTAPLTAITGTSLLTCQDKGRIADASSNSFAVTRAGDVKPVGESPFAQKGDGRWSAYFDGTGDYLSYTKTSATDFGTGDFTVEFWFNSTLTTRGDVAGQYTADATGSWGIGLNITGTRTIDFYNGNPTKVTASAGSWTSGVWNHAALVRSGTTLTFYVNGVSAGTATNSDNITGGNSNFYIGTGGGAGASFNGYISNLRIVKGTAVYTSAFTPPVAALTAIPGTSLLVLQDNRFKDNSSNNFALTKYGDTSVSRFNPFGTSGVVATTNISTGTGSWLSKTDASTSRLSVADNVALQMGTGDFTVDFWWCPTNIGTNQVVFDKGQIAAGGLTLWCNAPGYFILYCGTTSYGSLTSVQAVNGVWHHIAIFRTGGSVYLFVNGVGGGAADSTNLNGTAALTIPSNYPSYPGSGYYSNFRIIKGSAVYNPAAFVIPTTPSTAVAGTSLLTAQSMSGSAVDASSNAFTVTNTAGSGGSVEASPFKRVTYPYGGSGYFDGSGDYLSVPGSTIAFGTGDFTVECWVNPSKWDTSTGYDNFISGNESGAIQFCKEYSTTNLTMQIYGVGTIVTSSVYPPVGVWSHVVVARKGTTISLFVNGVRTGTATDSHNITCVNPAYVGWCNSNSQYYNGYISNLRVVKGTAVYDPTLTTLTVPTAPVTAVGGTSLLLNFDNAGIYDSSGAGVLSTTSIDGSANTPRVSTAAAKFGAGSVNFDISYADILKAQPANNFLFPGDFTVEAWVNQSGAQTFVFMSSTQMEFGILSSGKCYIQVGGTSATSASTVATVGQWSHVAVVRSGTTVTGYVNGVSCVSITSSTSLTDGAVRIGTNNAGNNVAYGYMDELRVTKSARYTSNFTPPAASFPTSSS